MTDPSRLDEIERIFHQVRSLPPEDRDARLQTECRDDDELRREVEQLLSFHDEEGLADEPTVPGEPITPPRLPERIGPFRILRLLGEGGMGLVYLAEQTEPVRRRVALKVIKLGMDSRALLARFEKERQTLAIMQHDGIAKVYDCGVTDTGQPFISMEWVKGEPLTTYCERRKLSLPHRISLVRQICAAVQHAHQKGVVHRDLTPRNVLVVDEGEQPRIKIIDFGLAKAMGPSVGEGSLVTDLQVVLGTPGYMAPEQANPANADIDTRADIYSIGAMLFELLVGSLPFEDLHERGIHEIQRTLRDTAPPRPSTRISSSGSATSHVATISGSTQVALLRALRQDLDWIVLKAIEADPDRRYASANELSSDLQCYLDNEPINAGPPSVRHRLSKTLRRHRHALAVSATVVLALAIGLVIALWQADVAKQQTEVAESALERYETLRHLALLTQGFEKEAEFVEDISNRQRMLEWLQKAAETRAKIPEYRGALARIEAKGKRSGNDYVFDNLTDEFEYYVYKSLVTMLHEAGPRALERVTNSLEWIERMQAVTIDDQAQAWQDARAAVRDDPRFKGMDLEPQLGLVPIGADPDSKLQEFWMHRTGKRPDRDADGHLIVKPDTGVVFVLLPGGSLAMGSDPDEPNTDPQTSWPNERPQHPVELAPFFMAKYEFTQWQWRQLQFAGENPSRYQFPGREHHPVERVDYAQVVAHLRRHKLLLPTEAQWEYACRADTTTRWFFGDRREDLVGRINGASNGHPKSDYWARSNDGWAVHAVVGKDPAIRATHHFLPNAFGLWHMHGNIAELTRGLAIRTYEGARHAVGDGEIIDGPMESMSKDEVVMRGGAFSKTVEDTRSAVRVFVDRHGKWDNVGFRASRAIDR